MKTLYLQKTKMGHEITTIGTYEYGDGTRYYFVIFYRKQMQDYNIALNYNFYEGTWGQGVYDFKSEERAKDYMYNKYKNIREI